ncbi:rhomboid family intramembrane serine protease [Paludibacter sp. 221]|uniref:rhomboid family intramembrane serine protease n=1 Tax=Paludibacter sp. 221 TaxID=2302939 RepID=UPI0013D312C5|nr:rhomboid family intramembrane serine protease [Paludibacter sp. 221]NDV46976.1 rhomboid family intramembrane serine protease [Paludibacter sp. 221]
MDISMLLIIGVTVVISLIGFNNAQFFDRYKFSTYAIIEKRQWDRLIASAFLHADWMHLIFNMLTFYFFAPSIIAYLGVFRLMIIYIASILGGNLLSLFVYRRDMTYTAIGASGGVCGVLFAAIALDPHIGIMFMFIPIPIPGWIFAILYLIYSIYGMKKALGNIGHAAHLGGALVGFVLAIIFFPETLVYNTLVIILVTIPLIFLGFVVYKER